MINIKVKRITKLRTEKQRRDAFIRQLAHDRPDYTLEQLKDMANAVFTDERLRLGSRSTVFYILMKRGNVI